MKFSSTDTHEIRLKTLVETLEVFLENATVHGKESIYLVSADDSGLNLEFVVTGDGANVGNEFAFLVGEFPNTAEQRARFYGRRPCSARKVPSLF